MASGRPRRSAPGRSRPRARLHSFSEPGARPVTATPLLQLSGISKRFGAVQALKQVDFEAYPGEVVALVGDNGAGKSTLIKIISGILPIDEGQVLFEGKPVKLSGPESASQLGIATVYQDLALSDNLDVVGNLFLGHELSSTGLGR